MLQSYISRSLLTKRFSHCLITGRMPRSGKLPVLNLLTGQKSRFSPRRGDSLHQTWQDRRAHESAWLCKISPQSPQGWECGPKNIKNFHFLVKSRPQEWLPWLISKFFRGFYASNYPTVVFHIWMIRFAGYWVIAEKPCVGQLGRIFTCTLSEKLYIGSKNESHLFWWARQALSPCKVWGRSHYTRRL